MQRQVNLEPLQVLVRFLNFHKRKVGFFYRASNVTGLVKKNVGETLKIGNLVHV